MIDDQPDLYEIDRMIQFCSLHRFIFIYGCEEKQLLLHKYLKMAQITIDGFVITNRGHWETAVEGKPIYTIEELKENGFNELETGFLLALPGVYYNDVLCRLQHSNYVHFFYISEYNKRTIAYKMQPRRNEQFWLEVNVSDHCNLNCRMCDHYSQLADKKFLQIERYKKDMGQLAKLMNGRMGIMKLQGGEPLLNRSTGKIIEITRQLFPETRIFLFTNGLLLLQSEHWDEGNLWSCMHENNVEVQLTQYPIKLDYEKIQEKADAYRVKMMLFKEAANRDEKIAIKTSVKHPHDLAGTQDKYSFISCYQFNECIVLRDGRIFTCPIIPYSIYLEKAFGMKFQRDNEGIDIYKVNSYEEIAEYLTHRSDFCKYCDVRNRKFGIEWKQSKGLPDLSEYVDL